MSDYEPTTAEEREAARVLCGEASMGPWKKVRKSNYFAILNAHETGVCYGLRKNGHDAEFITAARELLPRLLEDVERLSTKRHADYMDAALYAIYEIMKEADVPGSQLIRESGDTVDGMCAQAAMRLTADREMWRKGAEAAENSISCLAHGEYAICDMCNKFGKTNSGTICPYGCYRDESGTGISYDTYPDEPCVEFEWRCPEPRAGKMQKKPRPKITCLCGPMRFMDAFRQAEYDLEMQGVIVLAPSFLPGAATHDGTTGCTPEQKIMLDELHKRKIDMADSILVLNVGGYIGESTRSEIAYAQATGKPVRYLEELKQCMEGGLEYGA